MNYTSAHDFHHFAGFISFSISTYYLSHHEALSNVWIPFWTSFAFSHETRSIYSIKWCKKTCVCVGKKMKKTSKGSYERRWLAKMCAVCKTCDWTKSFLRKLYFLRGNEHTDTHTHKLHSFRFVYAFLSWHAHILARHSSVSTNIILYYNIVIIIMHRIYVVANISHDAVMSHIMSVQIGGQVSEYIFW